MLTSFEQIKQEVIRLIVTEGKKRLVLAASADEHALDAVKLAYDQGLVEPIFVGDEAGTRAICKAIDFDMSRIEMIPSPDAATSARLAVQIVRDGKADLIMKGDMATKVYLKAIVNSEHGIKKEKVLAAVTIIKLPMLDHFLVMTDTGMIISPSIEEKTAMIHLAAEMARCLGAVRPKVALLGAVELVNPAMPGTLDAAILSKMGERGQLGDVEVDGPLALDNIISMESVRHKGIVSNVAGQADIMVFPCIEVGNAVSKAYTYMGVPTGSIISGGTVPIIAPSRADTTSIKYNGILTAIIACNGGQDK
jgi:phosphate butyryltransferase